MTERKITDYLHFYLGCEVLLESEMYGTGGKPDKIRERLVGIDKDGASGENHILYEGDFKLILRPLSDMTEEEGKEIMKMIYQAIFHLDCELDAIDIIRGDENSFGMKAGESRYEERIGLTIEPHCGIELSVEGGKIMTPQFEATRWLLSKGFDLFGLIDSNLAINKSTLKP